VKGELRRANGISNTSLAHAPRCASIAGMPAIEHAD
jgi:hypothetical protein